MDVQPAGPRQRRTACSARSTWATRSAAPTGRASPTIPKRTPSIAQANNVGITATSLVDAAGRVLGHPLRLGRRGPAVPRSARPGRLLRGRLAACDRAGRQRASGRRQPRRQPAGAGGGAGGRRAGRGRPAAGGGGGLTVEGLSILKPPYGTIVGDQPRSRRDRLAGAARRHAGQRAQSSGAARA